MSRMRALMPATVIWVTLIGVTDVLGGDRDVSCWKASEFDKDGDGYAVRDAHKDDRVTFETSGSTALTCPAGWVKARGDCNDNNPSIFPRRHEVYGNNRDDNCDGRRDEPTFFYTINGYGTTPTSFDMNVRVHEQDVVAAYQSPVLTLAYRLEYQRLADTSALLTTGYRTVSTMNVNTWFAHTSATLNGLAQESVYRVRIQFYQKQRPLVIAPRRGGFVTAVAGGSKTSTPTFTPSYSSYTPVGEPSAWYYSATSSIYELGRTRTAMVRRAFYETYLSGIGYSGYRGYGRADGTRYGADMGERWCSEFYSWVADRHLNGVGHRANVASVKSYFTGRSAWETVTSPSDYVGLAEPGDYIGMDTSGDDKKNHSAMFLAYDAATDRIWTVDGNTSGRTEIGDGFDNRRAGNEAFVRERSPGVALGWGHIQYAMIRR